MLQRQTQTQLLVLFAFNCKPLSIWAECTCQRAQILFSSKWLSWLNVPATWWANQISWYFHLKKFKCPGRKIHSKSQSSNDVFFAKQHFFEETAIIISRNYILCIPGCIVTNSSQKQAHQCMKLLNVAPSVIISGRSAWMWQLVSIYYSNSWLWKFHESWVLWMLITCYCYPQTTIHEWRNSFQIARGYGSYSSYPPTYPVGGAITILKNMSSPMGLGLIIPYLWNGTSSSHVWNYQADILLFHFLTIINHRLTID